MSEPTNKQEVLDRIIDGRRELDALLEQIGPKDRTEMRVAGGWSVKDMLHHISSWERLMVLWVEQSLAGETPDRPAPDEEWDDIDETNEEIFAKGRDRSDDEVLAEFVDSYHNALDTVKSLTDADLFDGDRFAWRKGDPIWHLIAGNTWWHYKEHAESIQALLAGRA